MADETPDAVPDPPTDAPAAPGPEAGAAPPARVRGVKRRFLGRWTRRLLAVSIAIGAAVVVTFFTIDLGRFPQITRLAEVYGSRYLDRPLHIGGISAKVMPGDFVVENVVIDGKHPGDRPFMTIERIDVHLPIWWWALLQRNLEVEVRLRRWKMLVEKWPGGEHNVPRFGPKRDPKAKPLWFHTTVNAYALEGDFTYEDHETPWVVHAHNLDFDLVRAENLKEYVGLAHFGGDVQIMDYRPMATSMTVRFILDGAVARLQHVDLVTEGTRTHASGVVDFNNWPEQTYNVSSTVDLALMKSIYFPHASWTASGDAQFTGVFHLPKAGGRSLLGRFESALAGVNGLAFPHLQGDLAWTSDRFAVTDVQSDLQGGHMRLAYSLTPLGTPRPSTATFTIDYAGVNARGLGQFVDLAGLELAGRAGGDLTMTWPNGHFSDMRGEGHTTVAPPDGVALAAASLPDAPIAPRPESQPFDPLLTIGRMPVGADVHYAFDPDGITFTDSWAATAWTHVQFHGRAGYTGGADLPFRVASHDWQESDRVLTAILTVVSGQTEAIEVGGRGTFDGVMTGSFKAPRIGGHFEGDTLHVWNVTWGRAQADLVIENHFVDITSSRITRDAGSIVADGHYALGFRPDPAVEEIRSKVALRNWPMHDLRTAFGLEDWPIDGEVAAADLDLHGRYRDLYGTGTLRLDRGEAWKEPFGAATADLTLEGSGIRIDRIELAKASGQVHGAARIDWHAGTYSFNADGDRIPVESLENFKFPSAPMSGVLHFAAHGAAPFDAPTYEVEAQVPDLYVADEGIGPVSGTLLVKDRVLTFERLSAVSSRLLVFGSGSIALDDQYDSDLSFRFQETSLDPYLHLVAPSYTTYTPIIVSGSAQVRGPLSDWTHLLVDLTVDNSQIRLFEYDLANDGPVRMTFEDNTFKIGRLHLKGKDTALELSGSIDAAAKTAQFAAKGDASLSILQLFFPTLQATGAATLSAQLTGPLDKPILTGQAGIVNGRLRYFGVEHSLDTINGTITFDSKGINVDGLRAQLGGGPLTFGGAIALNGFSLGPMNLTASGRSMRLRYPVGFTTTVNADLTLTGSIEGGGVIGGDIIVLRTSYGGAFENENDLLGLVTGGMLGGGEADLGPAGPGSGDASLPLRLNIGVHMNPTTVIQSKTATLDASIPDLQILGTLDRPILNGRIEIESGEVQFSGNRYQVRPGSIDFSDPTKIVPVFDLELFTRPHVSGQTYDVTLRTTGTFGKIGMTLQSDPWLPDTDVMALLFGAAPGPGSPEQRGLDPQQSQERLIQTIGANLIASPLTARIGSVFEKVLPIDTVQITPVLGSEQAFQNLNPSARVTVGQRISSRVFLTYSRSLTGSQSEIILLEYEQSDRISWVLTRNEDRTYSLDFRVRYVF